MSFMMTNSDFKIRKKTDAVCFLLSGEKGRKLPDDGCIAHGCFSWSDGVNDYEIYTNRGVVCYRSVDYRGDMFQPMLAVDGIEAINIIWKTRKHVNKCIFERDI